MKKYQAFRVRQHFTQKERDNETGLDYFLARYYSSTQGRFTSPDEFTGGPDELYYFVSDASANPTFYANLAKPQSLNNAGVPKAELDSFESKHCVVCLKTYVTISYA